jgi:alkanesulfonate monooxygenase SsuD/methylene tetrahydromethanopterin reductase-like flavin-dependent oxidoreductase (luciferase family)
MTELAFGLDTFGDVPLDDSGKPVSQAAAIRQVVEEAVLADQLGVDAIAVGEHHRPEYSISTPETVLAGIATRTARIRLGSGVTVLSSDDPVRVFQRFATVDALSNGRAEVILGRGSFTESFPLFGYDLRDYDQLFEEKLDLFVKLLDEKPVTWNGTMRAPLENADVFPKTESGRLTTWVGVGGTPQSVVRTARYGLPLMLAIIGGPPERFASYIELYRRAAAQFSTAPPGRHALARLIAEDESGPASCSGHYGSHADRIWRCAAGRQSGVGYDAEIEHGSVARRLPTPSPADRPRRRRPRCRARRSTPCAGISAPAYIVEFYGSKVIPMVREILDDQSRDLDTT